MPIANTLASSEQDNKYRESGVTHKPVTRAWCSGNSMNTGSGSAYDTDVLGTSSAPATSMSGASPEPGDVSGHSYTRMLPTAVPQYSSLLSALNATFMMRQPLVLYVVISPRDATCRMHRPLASRPAATTDCLSLVMAHDVNRHVFTTWDRFSMRGGGGPYSENAYTWPSSPAEHRMWSSWDHTSCRMAPMWPWNDRTNSPVNVSNTCTSRPTDAARKWPPLENRTARICLAGRMSMGDRESGEGGEPGTYGCGCGVAWREKHRWWWWGSPNTRRTDFDVVNDQAVFATDGHKQTRRVQRHREGVFRQRRRDFARPVEVIPQPHGAVR